MQLSDVINKNIDENTILILECGTYLLYEGEININEFISVSVEGLIPEDLYTIEESKNIIILSRSNDYKEFDLSFNEKIRFDKLYIFDKASLYIDEDGQINTINSSTLLERNLTLEQENNITDRLYK